MQIQQQIMQELADIPEPKLFELYDLIHYFKLGLIHEKKSMQEEDFKIDAQACLEAFEKIQRGDKSGLTEIGDIDEYIENLRYEVSRVGWATRLTVAHRIQPRPKRWAKFAHPT